MKGIHDKGFNDVKICDHSKQDKKMLNVIRYKILFDLVRLLFREFT